MSNGYLVAAGADVTAAREVAGGFGLDVIDAAGVDNANATADALVGAANVGIVISSASARDKHFVLLVQALALRLRGAQLIAVDAGARAALPFLPAGWPLMSLDEARSRSQALVRQRGDHAGEEPPHAHPLPPAEVEPPVEVAPPVEAELPVEAEPEEPPTPETPREEESAPVAAEPHADGDEDTLSDGESFGGGVPVDSFGADDPNTAQAPPPATIAPEAPPHVQPTPAPQAPPIRERAIDVDDGKFSLPDLRGRIGSRLHSAPADATAFAPKKLRRGTPELVRIVIHQPKDLQAVIKAARKIDPLTSPAPSGMSIGEVALGSSVGVSLEVRGGVCDGALQRRTWAGDAIDFSFSVEADADVKQAVILARVFVDDAQIGVIGFTRPISGGAKAAPAGDKARLKRHKRVFISYSSKDRETVAAIATAYRAAGVQHFFDRTSLKSGEEWSPRLRGEIDKADLFHLCWSKSAASSEWVEKEAEHALTRRRRSSGKKPDITVQMLDGPPWAPHPPHLDSINFDDFVRAAIVGYARGDGEA